MLIKRIEWLSEEATEALLEISDGQHTCFAFCHPRERKVGEQLTSPLLAFSASYIHTTNEAESVLRVRDTLAHQVIGVVVSIAPTIVSVGGMQIEVEDALPGDVVVRDSIAFSCLRLDAR